VLFRSGISFVARLQRFEVVFQVVEEAHCSLGYRHLLATKEAVGDAALLYDGYDIGLLRKCPRTASRVWRTKGEYASLMKVRICQISFTTTSGIRHSAEIQADSLYEAAVEGIKAISQQWGEQPGLVTPIIVEVKAPTITHQLTLQQIQHWLESGCNSPKDKVTKDRLRKRLTA
jgi:hypothetical protein